MAEIKRTLEMTKEEIIKIISQKYNVEIETMDITCPGNIAFKLKNQELE